MNRNTIAARLAGAAAAALIAGQALAQDVTLTLHQFLPQQANVPTHILDVWIDRVEAASDGRIAINHFPAMQLGGTPPGLIDQAIDGVADIVWTVVGYTPGRFPQTEVFELPFMVDDARAGSYAFWNMFEARMADTDFDGVKILGTWVHGPGLFHTDRPVREPADLRGMKIRGGSRLVNELLTRVGAEPIGLPVPAIPEALSRGVIDGTTIPWEVTPSLRVPELVEYHTEFADASLYTLTFVLAMNEDRWNSLPDDLKAAIESESGEALSVFAGGVMQDYDAPARQMAAERGNTIITLEETAAWEALVSPIYDDWVAEMNAQGIDGQALIDEARALMQAYDTQ